MIEEPCVTAAGYPELGGGPRYREMSDYRLVHRVTSRTAQRRGARISSLIRMETSIRESWHTLTTPRDLKLNYERQARRKAEQRAVADDFSMFASCEVIGATYGVGVGLYFKALVWMKWMFLMLLIFAIPYLVVINTSVFTDEAHRFDHNFGVKVYRKPNLYSMTFAAILGGSADNSTLQYMNADIAGAWRGPMSKDAAAIVVALGMITYFINQARKFIQQVDDETLEMSDYSVMVHGL
ncbi:uncharacterized protein HaLaN_05841, partial [Haematococcus lacustris]